jgi:hypothetical protein
MKLQHVYLIPFLLLTGCGHSPQDYVNKADKFYADGKYADAELSYANALKKNPKLAKPNTSLD